MTTLYPLDFHRQVKGRWAERMKSAAADARGSGAHGRLAGEPGNEVPHAGEALAPAAHFKENAPVFRIWFWLAAVGFAAALSSTAAIAQASVSPPATKSAPAASAPDSSKSSTATQVETWTRKQWEAAKKEWARDTKKWTDCRERSGKQKLEGRKSWSFLYTCMTS
jgi:hypothetical protein